MLKKVIYGKMLSLPSLVRLAMVTVIFSLIQEQDYVHEESDFLFCWLRLILDVTNKIGE